MSKLPARGKKSKPRPKPNNQIPNSLVRQAFHTRPGSILKHARDYPIYGCWIMADWKDSGITSVVIARKQDDEKIMFGLYLVDLYCLGIKNVYTQIDYSVNRFKRKLPELLSDSPEKCSVELAHEVIYGALEYAEKIGFHPHPDFKNQMADLMLDPPYTYPRLNHVAFGKDGKPCYIPGPYEDDRKITLNMNTLERTCGEGNFDYIIGFSDFEYDE
jgi:hypothetical protein